MPDDPNAALIRKMIAANYGGTMEDAMRGIGSENMEAEAAAMSRVLAVVREHDAQELADRLRSEVMTLEHLGGLWVAAEDYAAMEAARDAAQEEADAEAMANEEAQEVAGCLAQEMAEVREQIATLTAERDEALRRRDAWRAKAEGYDEMAATVRAKVKEAGPSSPRALLRAALVEAEGRIAGLCDALTMMLAAREADGVAVDAAILRARAELAKENPNA